MNKKESGRLGGNSTLRKYGVEFFSRIGKLGYKAFVKKYSRKPILQSRWAVVNNETNQIVSIF